MSRQLCYELISEPFYYGQYLDLKIVINNETGYFNASRLCSERGKHIHHWLSMNQTIQLVKAYNEEPDMPAWTTNVCGQPPPIAGTYIHPRLLPALAMWISPKFYYMAAEVVEKFAVRAYERHVFDLRETQRFIEFSLNNYKAINIGLSCQLVEQARELTDAQQQVTQLEVQVEQLRAELVDRMRHLDQEQLYTKSLQADYEAYKAEVTAKQANMECYNQIPTLPTIPRSTQTEKWLENLQSMSPSSPVSMETHTSKGGPSDFKLFRKNKVGDEYQYVMAHVQKCNLNRCLKRIATRYPDCVEVLSIPNAAGFKNKRIKFKHHNELKSEFDDEETFINYIKELVA